MVIIKELFAYMINIFQAAKHSWIISISFICLELLLCV